MYYISDLNSNLLSVFYLINYKYHIYFLLQNTQPTVKMNDSDSHVIVYSYEKNGLFIFDSITCFSDECVNITTLSNLELVNNSVKEETNKLPQKKFLGFLTIWHKHLKHIANAIVKKLFKKQIVKEIEINDHNNKNNIHQYSICFKGKMT